MNDSHVFHLFQFSLSNRAIRILEASDWGSDNPEVKAFHKATHLEQPELAIAGGYYKHVSDIQADTLDGAFDYGSVGPEARITRHASMRSPSVGDVFLSDEGKAHFCMGVGWKELDYDQTQVFWNARVGLVSQAATDEDASSGEEQDSSFSPRV